jgi:hypothetical protein
MPFSIRLGAPRHRLIDALLAPNATATAPRIAAGAQRLARDR